MAEEALTTIKVSDKYKPVMDNIDLPKGDKLNTINDALTELHVIIVGTGKVAVIEAKNFRFFVKKEFEALMRSDLVEKETAGVLLSAVVWSAFDKYVKFKMGQIEEIQRRKGARIQKILDKRK